MNSSQACEPDVHSWPLTGFKYQLFLAPLSGDYHLYSVTDSQDSRALYLWHCPLVRNLVHSLPSTSPCFLALVTSPPDATHSSLAQHPGWAGSPSIPLSCSFSASNKPFVKSSRLACSWLDCEPWRWDLASHLILWDNMVLSTG